MNVYLQKATKILFPFYFRYRLYSLSDDIMNMEILFSLSEIVGSKSKIQIFYVIFFNKDISITTKDIAMRLYDNSSYLFRVKHVELLLVVN